LNYLVQNSTILIYSFFYNIQFFFLNLRFLRSFTIVGFYKSSNRFFFNFFLKNYRNLFKIIGISRYIKTLFLGTAKSVISKAPYPTLPALRYTLPLKTSPLFFILPIYLNSFLHYFLFNSLIIFFNIIRTARFEMPFNDTYYLPLYTK
jgi:hypothetical protein